jgi:hypothetical protein
MKRDETLRKRERVFVITCLLLLLFLTLYLLTDVLKKSLVLAGDGPVIGNVVFLHNDVRRKPAAGEGWETLLRGADVFDEDTLESGADATASILLTDGTMIDLCADSMIALDRSGDETRVSIARGCGDITRTGSRVDRNRRLVLVDGDRRVTLDIGALSADKKPGQAPGFFVRSGTARVDIKGREQTLRAGERAVLNDASVSVEKNNLTLGEPADGKLVYTQGRDASLRFSWDYDGETNGDMSYTLEISRNRDFTRVVKREKLHENAAGATLPDESYFWRVSVNASGALKTERSEPGRFTVLRDGPVVLLAPADEEMLDYAAERPQIVFSWEPHPIATSYRLEISDRSDFSNIIRKFDTRVVNLTCPWERDVPPGGVRTFFWRVSAVRDGGDWNGRTSDLRSFSIQKVRKLYPAQLVSPRDRKKICRPCADRENVIFSWERTEEGLDKKIYFSNDKNFGTIYREIPIDRNYWTMVKAFPAGIYFWRVGLSGEKAGTVYSGARSFIMQDYEDIALIAPEDEAGFIASDDNGGVKFSWKKPEAEGKYLVELSDNREMTQVRSTIRSTTTSAMGRDLAPGTYFWRVIMIDGNNTTMAASDARSFTVEEGLAAPVIIAPRSGRGVDMSNQNALNFLWKPSRGATSYLLELHQIVRDRTRASDRRVVAAQTSDARYSISDMNLLDVGSFYWTLKAVKRGPGGRVIRSSRKLKNDFKISVLGGSKVIVISPKIQVIEDEKRKK